jgi:hypothetical protein
MLWHPDNRVFLGGQVPDEPGEFLKAAPLPTFAPFVGGFAIFEPLGPAWTDAVKQSFAGRCRKDQRVCFRMERPGVARDGGGAVPPGMTVRRIDAPLAQVQQKSGFLWIEPYWGSFERFVRDSFGFCLVDEKQRPVSVATAFAIGGGRAELDLISHIPSRGRGYGTLVAAAFVAHCAEVGLEPVWTCNQDNPASMAVARKLGFVEDCRYDWFAVDPPY